MKYNYTKKVYINNKYEQRTIKLNNLRTFKITYSTSRIMIKDTRFNKKIYIAKDYINNSWLDTAITYLSNILKINIHSFSCLDSENFDIIQTLDFKTELINK
tara:strand:+ start:373 stop:678 length:306 start_codon:yes stop_codon:yes gene_type:complete